MEATSCETGQVVVHALNLTLNTVTALFMAWLHKRYREGNGG